ncbi:hypothetical protein VSX64_18020 [Aurantimonas sp. C2-6-R+9]|uniref:hypothetical protein n=1 Tax=unclassified Aurantimonas TaxID=2638230 RepID=UPI002E187D77|nr:hypothetical protein [Aurantimonas sp. C2-6-R+9]
MIVYGTLYVLFLLPILLFGIIIGFSGPWALVHILSNPYGFVDFYQGANHELRMILDLVGMILAVCMTSVLVLKLRFFT